MIAISILSLLRLLSAFCLVMWLIPLLAERRAMQQFQPPRGSAGQAGVRALRLFVHGSLASEVTALLLGRFGLFLPGLLIAPCVLLAVWNILPEKSEDFWTVLLAALEDPQSAVWKIRRRAGRHLAPLCTRTAAVTAVVAVILLLISARFQLTQFHFAYPGTYLNAVSLAALNEGQATRADEVAILGPLAPMSGMDAASVIRFSGPLFTVAFILIIALSLYRTWASSAAIAAVAAFSAALLYLAPATASEWTPELAASGYWIAAGILWPVSRRDGALAALTAVMALPTLSPWPAIGLALLACAALASRASRRPLRFAVAAINACVCMFALVVFVRWNAKPVHLTEYESAARVCNRIDSEFHHRQWIVVSPFQELAFTYGRGWHVELSDFVSKFTTDEVSSPQFKMPYDCPDVFFFVERRPLTPGIAPRVRKAVWRYSPADSSDWPAFLYTDPVGRTSLEYRAAELLTAYARHHLNLSVFYEDEDLLVFRYVRS